MEKLNKLENFIKQLTKGILVYFLFSYSYLFQYIPVILLKLDVNNLDKSFSVMLSSFSSLIVLFILFFIYRKEIKKEWDIFRKDILGCLDQGFKYWFIGLIIMFCSNLIITAVFHSGGANNETAVQSMIKVLPWLMLINAGIIAPIVEEIVFRKTVKNAFSNKYLFIIISGLIFGLVHVTGSATVWTDWLYIIPYGALGASFAAAYYKTDTIFTSISCHMFHNIILILFSII